MQRKTAGCMISLVLPTFFKGMRKMDKSSKPDWKINIVNLSKRHHGKIVALRRVPGGWKIVVFSRRYSYVAKNYKKRGANGGIMFIQERGILYTHAASFVA